jgi:hypothetical protein
MIDRLGELLGPVLVGFMVAIALHDITDPYSYSKVTQDVAYISPIRVNYLESRLGSTRVRVGTLSMIDVTSTRQQRPFRQVQVEVRTYSIVAQPDQPGGSLCHLVLLILEKSLHNGLHDKSWRSRSVQDRP